jgi:hypothetical protein
VAAIEEEHHPAVIRVGWNPEISGRSAEGNLAVGMYKRADFWALGYSLEGEGWYIRAS